MAQGRRLNYDVAPLSSHRFRKYHHMYITPIILYIISPFVKYILIINKNKVTDLSDLQPYLHCQATSRKGLAPVHCATNSF